jgi:hypothetical protein
VAIDEAGVGVLSYRKFWNRVAGQRSKSQKVDLEYERCVDELFDPDALLTMQATVVDDPPARTTLTDAELSNAWRASYRALRLAEDPRDQARIAAARACYLDAVQERDPAGFARWVCSEGAVWRDPAPFLSPERSMDV